MGCLVNGPGEMCQADFGVCGFKGKGALYARGERLRTVENDKITSELLKEINREARH